LEKMFWSKFILSSDPRPKTNIKKLKGFLSSIRFSKTPLCLTQSTSALSLPVAPRSLNCAGHLD
jgi:hypothetical protein